MFTPIEPVPVKLDVALMLSGRLQLLLAWVMFDVPARRSSTTAVVVR